MGRAVAADGVGTVIASAVGGSPTTTYAENIGVMAATRVYSTAAYFVAAIVAILLGLVPKFGAIVNATPPAVLGGITLVLYGMIGLLGAKIWKENRVNFANPVNLVPIAAGIILGHRRRRPEVHRRLHAHRHRARHAWSSSSATTWPASVAPTARDDGAVIAVGHDRVPTPRTTPHRTATTTSTED